MFGRSFKELGPQIVYNMQLKKLYNVQVPQITHGKSFNNVRYNFKHGNIGELSGILIHNK